MGKHRKGSASGNDTDGSIISPNILGDNLEVCRSFEITTEFRRNLNKLFYIPTCSRGTVVCHSSKSQPLIIHRVT